MSAELTINDVKLPENVENHLVGYRLQPLGETLRRFVLGVWIVDLTIFLFVFWFAIFAGSIYWTLGMAGIIFSCCVLYFYSKSIICTFHTTGLTNKYIEKETRSSFPCTQNKTEIIPFNEISSVVQQRGCCHPLWLET
jgi:hypothetical protein